MNQNQKSSAERSNRSFKTAFKKCAVKLLGNSKYQFVSIPIFAILLSLIAGAIVISLVGANPLSAYYNLLQGTGIMPKASYAGGKGMLTDFASMLNALTPMLFASLAVAVAFKAGLFNIGVAGQMLGAGFFATILVGYSELNGVIAKPLVLLIGIVVGGLIGAFIGFLKYRFNINEVVASIMINYILQYVISFFINTYFVDPVSRQSRYISDAARLTLMNVKFMGLKLEIPLGIIIAIAAAFFIRFLLNKTWIGYEIKLVGENSKAAKYAGVDVKKNIVLAMLISGALAGLAGVTYYMGYFASIQPKVLASLGYDAIAVSLLGNSNPIGVIFSSLLITVISKGSTYMSSISGVEQEIASVITSMILLFSACGAFIKYLVKHAEIQLDEMGDVSAAASKEDK